jgi:hypothetical protein
MHYPLVFFLLVHLVLWGVQPNVITQEGFVTAFSGLDTKVVP